VRGCSEFHQAVYLVCGYYCVYDNGEGVTGQKARFLHRQAATCAHLRSVEQAVEAGKHPDLAALKVLRQWRWLLTLDEDARVQRLIIEERRKRQNFLEGRMLQDAEAAAAKEKVGGAAAGSAPEVQARDDAAVTVTGSGGSAGGGDAPKAPAAKKAKGALDPSVDERMAPFYSEVDGPGQGIWAHHFLGGAAQQGV